MSSLRMTVAPAMQDLLASDRASPETRKRVQGILANLKPWLPRTAEALRHGRAVQVLELIGTAEAQALLTLLAADAETLSQLGHDARRALARLRNRGT